MGLSDDIDEDALGSSELDEFEEELDGVMDALVRGETEAALSHISALIGKMYEVDPDGFSVGGDTRAKPEVHIEQEHMTAAIDHMKFDEGAEFSVAASGDGVGVWTTVPGSERRSSVGLHLSPSAAVNLSSLLRETATRASAGDSWEYNE